MWLSLLLALTSSSPSCPSRASASKFNFVPLSVNYKSLSSQPNSIVTSSVTSSVTNCRPTTASKPSKPSKPTSSYTRTAFISPISNPNHRRKNIHDLIVSTSTKTSQLVFPFSPFENTPSTTHQLHSSLNNNNNNNNNNSITNRLQKQSPLNRRKHHTKRKKRSKTYKEIKQERRELDSMRRSLSQKQLQHNQQKHHQQHRATSSFSTPTTNSATNNSNKNLVTQRLHDIHSIRNSRTSEEEKRSNDRIYKAQQLLDDFTIMDDDDDDETMDSTTTTSTTTTTTSTMTNNEMETNNDMTTTTTSITVPDTVWYNGNLQSGKGNYVTRWSQGMKVAEPLRKYDPIRTEQLLFAQPTKWIIRNIQIGLPLVTWMTGVIYDIITDVEETNRRNRAKQLLDTVSGLGPAIIKGGQALASRSDLLPNEYLEQLQKLQDDVPRFDNKIAFRIVEEELGLGGRSSTVMDDDNENDGFSSVFELIQNDPVAAASIGQVYKARLRSNGDIVALKIQRPKCEEIIALDLFILRWWSGVANIVTNLLNRDIDVQSIIDDFGELIYRELDYVAEAANAQRFSELYANEVKDVFVPKVYSELTTSKVLTMEWVEGFRLTDNDNLEKYGLDRKKLVDTLVQCSLRQILGNGFCKFLLFFA